MSCRVLIVGVPSPAGCAASATWRAAAEFVFSRLSARYGDAVEVEYVELFAPDMSRHPDVESWIASGEATPPLVAIDGVRRFAGGKLNASAIERAVAAIVDQRSSPVAAASGTGHALASRLASSTQRFPTAFAQLHEERLHD